MANALHRNIAVNEEVVVRADVLKEEFRAPEKRIFVCKGGFGMSSYTSGAKIMGYFKFKGEHTHDTIRGEWISVGETELLKAGQLY